VIETTFVEVPLAEIDTFIELQKKVLGMIERIEQGGMS
jgi:hypothetical protein